MISIILGILCNTRQGKKSSKPKNKNMGQTNEKTSETTKYLKVVRPNEKGRTQLSKQIKRIMAKQL
jgi:hypothetical protein